MKTAIPMKVELGTVIHGTHRPEDLIPTFLYELKSIPMKYHNLKMAIVFKSTSLN